MMSEILSASADHGLDSRAELGDIITMKMLRLTRLMLLAVPRDRRALSRDGARRSTPAPNKRRLISPPRSRPRPPSTGASFSTSAATGAPDCQVLDLYFHDAANRPILEANFVLVHINIGHGDQNLDIAARYGIPLDKGVPALAVLNRHGKLLYSQRAW